MSANNQHLIAEYQDKWYVFLSVQAEAWDEENEISLKNSDFSGTQEECFRYAFSHDGYDTEYGIGFGELVKDGSKVTLIP